MARGDTRQFHYIPEFLLKNFTDDDPLPVLDPRTV